MRAKFEEVYSELGHRQDETPWEHFVFVFRVCLNAADLTQLYGIDAGVNRSWLVELGLLDYEGPLPAWITADSDSDWNVHYGPIEDMQPCTQMLGYTRQDFLTAMENLYGADQMGRLLMELETAK